jgi:hypothetical protein
MATEGVGRRRVAPLTGSSGENARRVDSPDQAAAETRRPGRPKKVLPDKRKERSRDLPPYCLRDCIEGCVSCCGERKPEILAVVKRAVDGWDEELANFDLDGDPEVGEWVTCKIHRSAVLAQRRSGNVFDGKIAEKMADGRYSVRVKQRKGAKTATGFFVLPRNSIGRKQKQIPATAMEELAYRIGEDAYVGMTRFRVRNYRSRVAERLRSTASAD